MVICCGAAHRNKNKRAGLGPNEERKMKKTLYGFSALLLTACAATSDQSSMSAAELSSCLQPNRRVVIDVNGRVAKPPAKKPAAKPEAAAEAAPTPAPKPAKPEFAAFEQATYVQGDSAF